MANGSVTGPTDDRGYYIKLTWSSSVVATPANTSSVTATLTLHTTVPGRYFSNWTISNNIKSNTVTWGTAQSKQYSISNPTSTTERSVVLYTFTRNVTHDADGNKTIDWEGNMSLSGTNTFLPRSPKQVTTTATLDYIAPPVTTYTVSFDDDNTNNPNPANQTVNSGSTFTFPSAGTKTGYSYLWYLGGDTNTTGYSGGATSAAVTSNQSWKAVWFANSYTLTYDVNGGNALDPSDKAVTYNSAIGTLPTPTRSGFSFNGWFTAVSGGSQVTSTTTYATDGDSTIYARWTANSPTWTDETISSPITIDRDISGYSDRTVSAANATSYSITHVSGPQSTTNWLSINNSGQLSGSTNIVGTYRFFITATSAGGSVNSNTLSIVVNYPGKRVNTSLVTVPFEFARRYVGPFATTTDANGNTITADSSGYVPITRMRKWNGSSWENITN